MLILSIETSCDETAVSLVEAQGDFPHATYEILGNAIWSQVDIHREFGGVFPAIAKREHASTLTPLLEKVFEHAELSPYSYTPDLLPETESAVRTILNREHGLADQLITFYREHGTYSVDLIAVTSGPGLEPALWVGVNFARSLALLWNVPVIPVNHMEGHILASLFDSDRDDQLSDIEFPAIALLISGGHTELILMSGWGRYEKIGQTRDDAVGEAFDKVARLLGLSYPGGPEISRRATEARKRHLPPFVKLPTPMLNSGDLDFSFSGLKTAVRYAVQDKELSKDDILALSRDFEDVVTQVLTKKTSDAVDKYNAKTLIVGGGVSANQHIKKHIAATMLINHPDTTCYFPKPGLSTDNSIMIALTGHSRASCALAPEGTDIIRADGNKDLN